ncbi:T9SS type A sorting domain-containing protein [Candidatus Fermentibacteria bacterium]|nr:T9SS type A sorting domain-containing protein [Candidatus Fermentibacteria bacterium]
MAVLLILSMLAQLPTVNAPGDWVSLSGEAGQEPAINILESNRDRLIMEVEIPGFWMVSEEHASTTFLKAIIPEYTFHEVEPGNPEIPQINLLVGVPNGCTAVIESAEAEWVEMTDVLLRPFQELQRDGMPTPPFTWNRDSYRSEATMPEQWSRMAEPGSWSGLNVARLEVNPLRYVPAEEKLLVTNKVRIAIEFEGEALPETPTAASIARSHGASLINYEDLQVPIRDNYNRDDVVFILVTNDDNLDAITPLVTLDHVLGLPLAVEVLSNPASISQIRNAINNNYQSGVTRFAMIVGNHSQLPSYSGYGFYSDYYYALIDGDNYPELAVGRYSDTADDLPNQVDKMIAYMSHTGSGSTSIPAEAALAAHEENYPQKYTQCKNNIASYGYTLTDVTFYKFYPPEGASASDLENRINQGVGTVNYRGHGSHTSWLWSPGWNAGNIYDLTNDFYPIVFNIACDCGYHGASYNCLSESWMAAPDIGASSNCGASDPSYTSPNHQYDRELYWGLYRDGVTRIGECFNDANVAVINGYGSYGLKNARMYHWFGDPAQDAFNCDENGSPYGLDLSGESPIPPGSQSRTYTVTSGGSPVQGVTITATDGLGDHPDDPQTFYVQDNTNSSGEVTLSFTAVQNDTVRVGAWKHNYAYDTMDIPVTEEGIGGSGLPVSLTVEGPLPNPTAGMAIVRVTSSGPVEMGLTVHDVSGRTVSTVERTTLGSGVNEVPVSCEDLPTGVYVVKIDCDQIERTMRMVVIR